MLNCYSELGETFVNINDKKTKDLDELLPVERRLASREVKNGKLPGLKKKKKKESVAS